MTITIDLAPEEEARLRERAVDAGQPTEAVAAALLRQSLAGSLPIPARPAGAEIGTAPMTDEEFDAYWGPYIGVIRGSHEALSENCGERFTDKQP